MAGGGSAFVRLEKPDNAIGQGLQYWGGLKAQEIEADKGRQERAGIEANKATKEWEEKYGYNYEDFKNTITGFNSFDQITTNFARNTSTEYANLARQAAEARRNGDRKTQWKIEDNLQRLKGSFGQVKEMEQAVKSKFEQVQKLYLEGKLSGVDSDWMSQLQAIIENNDFMITLDENYNVKVIGEREVEGGGKETFEINYLDLINDKWRPYKHNNISGKGGVIDGILTNLGKKSVDNRTGTLITTDQVWTPEIEKAALGQIQSQLTDDVMADLYFQLIDPKSKKRTGFVEEEYNQVRRALLDMVQGGYDETEKIAVNTSEQELEERMRDNAARRDLANRRLNLDKDKFASDKEYRTNVIKEAEKSFTRDEKIDLEDRRKSLVVFAVAEEIKKMQEEGGGKVTQSDVLNNPTISKAAKMYNLPIERATTLGFNRDNKVQIKGRMIDVSENTTSLANELMKHMGGSAYIGDDVEDDYLLLNSYKDESGALDFTSADFYQDILNDYKDKLGGQTTTRRNRQTTERNELPKDIESRKGRIAGGEALLYSEMGEKEFSELFDEM